MHTSSTLHIPSGMWALEFTAPANDLNDELFSLDDPQYTLRADRLDGCTRVMINSFQDQKSSQFSDAAWFDFELYAPEPGEKYRIEWLDSVIRLFVDDKLIDEEWPLGEPACGECSFHHPEAIRDLRITPLSQRPANADIALPCPAQFYKPPYHNASVGDCMPFVSGGRYRLYHLFDRRHHESKQGLGAHQWAQISTDDLKNWTLHPISLGIDEQWEGSICTGSMIEHEGKIYAFYAVRMSDGSPAKLSWAVSEDGVHFEKSHEYFSLTDPYEPVSARDPKVFKDATGLYHMLVTTSILDGRTRPGCLAHLTSRDLISWTQLEPMLVPGYPGQPECSDYFEWNGYYYIVFANHLVAHYRISDHPFGPWRRPKDDTLISVNLAVPKTADWNGRRLVSGWIADGGWGGYAITHELVQRADGSLGVKYIEEMMPELNRPSIHEACADGSASYTECPLTECEDPFRLKGVVSLSNPGAIGELILRFENAEYRIAFDPTEKTVSVCFPDQSPLEIGMRSQILNADGLDRPFAIDLIACKGILMLLLPDGRMLMPPQMKHTGKCSLRMACRDGKMQLAPEN